MKLKEIILVVIFCLISFLIGFNLKGNEKEIKSNNDNNNKSFSIVELTNILNENLPNWNKISPLKLNTNEYKTTISIDKTEKSEDACDIYVCENMKIDGVNKKLLNYNKTYYISGNFYKGTNVKNTFNKIFKNGNLLTNDYKIIGIPLTYIYDERNNGYVLLKSDGISSNPSSMNGIYSNYQTDNKLNVVITYNPIFYDKNNYKYIVLKDNTKLDADENKLYDYIVNYSDKMELYELNFEINNNNYKFINAKKVN